MSKSGTLDAWMKYHSMLETAIYEDYEKSQKKRPASNRPVGCRRTMPSQYEDESSENCHPNRSSQGRRRSTPTPASIATQAQVTQEGYQFSLPAGSKPRRVLKRRDSKPSTQRLPSLRPMSASRGSASASPSCAPPRPKDPPLSFTSVNTSYHTCQTAYTRGTDAASGGKAWKAKTQGEAKPSLSKPPGPPSPTAAWARHELRLRQRKQRNLEKLRERETGEAALSCATVSSLLPSSQGERLTQQMFKAARHRPSTPLSLSPLSDLGSGRVSSEPTPRSRGRRTPTPTYSAMVMSQDTQHQEADTPESNSRPLDLSTSLPGVSSLVFRYRSP
ncbi:hypothetical protein KIPB_012356 [Kipferlia bialata]|uniref:Uncharacterized protein n=1 Tax=Kipferlia bialata TaxID=797122 RepID=A0A9K3D8T5_9EUKA|nr:hypothetical protein KIPB_012356 [Kipferlia bialata]|eukprot:g12356.t1